jgi:hypothetical protein
VGHQEGGPFVWSHRETLGIEAHRQPTQQLTGRRLEHRRGRLPLHGHEERAAIVREYQLMRRGPDGNASRAGAVCAIKDLHDAVAR